MKKGVILAAGHGTRLYPCTIAVNKAMLPIYNKPAIYFPITTLMQCGCREILIVTNVETVAQMDKLLGDGRQWGISIEYAIQGVAEGVVSALEKARGFCGKDEFCLMLGDNILIDEAGDYSLPTNSTSTVFLKHVPNPVAYGVAELDADGRLIGIEEKPAHPKSDYAIIGFYRYSPCVWDYTELVRPRINGERNISDLNEILLKKGLLQSATLPPDVLWYDIGDPDSMLNASNRVADMIRGGREVGEPSVIID